MGLIDWVTSKVSGVDLGAEQARGDAADAALANLNSQALANGTWSQAQFDQAEADRATGATGNVNQAVTDEFWAGWNDAEANLTGGIKNSIGGLFNGVWSAIPWQLILLAGVALFLYMGGADLLKGILKKK